MTERELSWSDLDRVLREHEARHNHRALEAVCRRYHPRATRVRVEAYLKDLGGESYFAYSAGTVVAWAGDRELRLPGGDAELQALLAASPGLRAELPEGAADPLDWLAHAYADAVDALELRGPERGEAVEVDLTLPAPPPPARVYTKGPTEGEVRNDRRT